MTSRDERNARYRQGLCVTCGLRQHSPGRTRCESCHKNWLLAGCPADDMCPHCRSTNPDRIHYAHCPTVGARHG